jgi:putative toxin-antitoxin system antitoxin component (TIGR02293 family)
MKTLTVEDDYTLINTAHEGISIQYFDKLLQMSGIQKGLLAFLVGIDVKTVDNYRKNDKKFDILEGELLLKLERLFIFGEEVFEDMKEFREWLQINSISLGNKKPIELLNTSTGVDLVYDELMRIAHGYVV